MKLLEIICWSSGSLPRIRNIVNPYWAIAKWPTCQARWVTPPAGRLEPFVRLQVAEQLLRVTACKFDLPNGDLQSGSWHPTAPVFLVPTASLAALAIDPVILSSR